MYMRLGVIVDALLARNFTLGGCIWPGNDSSDRARADGRPYLEADRLASSLNKGCAPRDGPNDGRPASAWLTRATDVSLASILPLLCSPLTFGPGLGLVFAGRLAASTHRAELHERIDIFSAHGT
ncbi:hypothetical protein CDD83_10662 [Cordyceps sp. RAO-2017]|nr:hypothetical protein CDD83_10662 [Cordyceps sp. RAO-2017]